jgi:excisionase family DNA binding protein
MSSGMLEPRSGPAGAAARIPERLWSVEETARFLGLPVATLYQLNHKKTGPRSYKVGRHRRYDPADVMAWLAERASDAD